MIRKEGEIYILIINMETERYDAGGGFVIAAKKLTVENPLSCRGYFPPATMSQNIPVAFKGTINS